MWFYSNTSVPTTLTNDITATDTSIQIGDSTGLPVQFPFTLVLDFEAPAMEVVTVTSQAGSSFIVQRGQDGTSAQPHQGGAVVVHAAVARDLQEPQVHIASDQNVHGVGASSFVVGTDSTQTLTNKTMDGDLNTFVNIHASSIDPFTFLQIDQTQDTNPGLEIFGHDGVSTLPNVWVHVGDIQDGIVIQQIDGPTEPGFALTVQTPSGVDRFSVTKDGNLQSVGTVDVANSRIHQLDTAVVGLLVDAPAGSANDLVRIVADTGATGLHVRRNSSTTTGSNLQAWVTETGTSMATVSRAGILTLNQQLTNSQTLVVNANPAAATSAVRFFSGNGQAALDIRRAESSTTGNMLTLTNESGTTMASYTRTGQLNLTQPVGSVVALQVTQNASPSTAAVRIVSTGTSGQPALEVARNNATTTGFLQTWTDQSGGVLASLSRAGDMVASNVRATNDVIVGNDGSGDLVVNGEITMAGYPVPVTQFGEQLISFTNQTSAFVDVTFPQPFLAGTRPAVVASVSAIAGQANGWWVRTANITNTNFRMSVSAINASSWSNIPVSWVAVGLAA